MRRLTDIFSRVEAVWKRYILNTLAPLDVPTAADIGKLFLEA